MFEIFCHMSEIFVEYLILTMWYGSSFSNHTRAGLVDGVSVEKNIFKTFFIVIRFWKLTNIEHPLPIIRTAVY